MTKGETSKKRILLEAFKLFATLPYELVSFKVLETEIGISRGSMVYYFKNKEGLFKEILNTFIFNSSSVKSVPDAYKLSLYSFFSYFIEILKTQQESLSKMGIENVNEALIRIENSALTYIKDFKETVNRWLEEETEVWLTVIARAVHTEEIRKDTDILAFASIFESCYLGTSYSGVFGKSGYDINKLESCYNNLYKTIKNNT